VLVREGDDQLEAFGAGEAQPALGWLLEQRRAVALHAPDAWHEAVRSWFGRVESSTVETWAGAEMADSNRDIPGSSTIVTRRLTRADGPAFAASTPAWALRGWGEYDALIDHGAAFGVPYEAGFASMAWVFDQVERYDALGVFTAPRFRRLGLGRASASSLIDHITTRRDKAPLWSTALDNPASRALAEVLGFSPAATETVSRWSARE
jgi:GNAT superfamily N-acetyltransferase